MNDQNLTLEAATLIKWLKKMSDDKVDEKTINEKVASYFTKYPDENLESLIEEIGRATNEKIGIAGEKGGNAEVTNWLDSAGGQAYEKLLSIMKKIMSERLEDRELHKYLDSIDAKEGKNFKPQDVGKVIVDYQKMKK